MRHRRGGAGKRGRARPRGGLLRAGHGGAGPPGPPSWGGPPGLSYSPPRGGADRRWVDGGKPLARTSTFALFGAVRNPSRYSMFSHIVIFWTDPANPNAIDDLVAGAEKYLKPIPLTRHFHCGRMATSER